MTLSPDMIDAMVAAGLTQEQMATLLKASLLREEAVAAERRAKAAAKKRRQRAAKVEMSPVVPGTAGDMQGQTGTERDSAGHGSPAPLDGPLPSPTPQPTPLNPPAHSGSDAIASAAGAATDPAEPDPRRELFGRGKATVRRMTGRSNDQCASLLGKWLKLANDSAVIVLAAVDEAETQELANPVPWIGQRIQREMSDEQRSAGLFARPASGGGYGQPSFDDRVAGVASAVDRFRQRPGVVSREHVPPNRGAGQARPDDPSVVDAEWAPARRYS